ncbi:MAG: transposase [Phycisphaerales bacterium]|nr:MAG: transposase [Phycisphaerales bacterium]
MTVPSDALPPPPPPPRKHLRRHEDPHHARFLTFSCFRRLPLLFDPDTRDCLARHLERTRARWKFHLYAWVVMPEHVHLLLWPRLPDGPVAKVLHDLKRSTAQETIGWWRGRDAGSLAEIRGSDGTIRIWQRGGGYDRNISSLAEFDEKLRYIHENPVCRGLVPRPEDWAWSSARWHAGWGGDCTGPVAIDPLPPTRPAGSPSVGEGHDASGGACISRRRAAD